MGTMTVQALLDHLMHAGVTARLVNRRLQIVAKPGTLTPLLREAITEHRAAIIDVLTPRTHTVGCTGCGRFHYVEPAPRCYWCRAAAGAVTAGDAETGAGGDHSTDVDAATRARAEGSPPSRRAI